MDIQKKNISNFWKNDKDYSKSRQTYQIFKFQSKKDHSKLLPKLLSIRNWLSYQRIIEIGSQGTEVHKPSQLPWTWLPQPTLAHEKS